MGIARRRVTFSDNGRAPNMLATTVATNPAALMKSRNKTVAKSFYRQLKSEGFSHEQIIDLSATLLDLVTQDIKGTDRVQ